MAVTLRGEQTPSAVVWPCWTCDIRIWFMAAAIPPAATFVVSGNLVIQFLAAALFVVAGALIAVIVYVFRSLAKDVERLANQVEALPDALGNRIDSVANALGNRIDSVGSLLGNRIDDVASSLGNRIDKLTDRMDKLSERIDRLADTLHAEIASVRQDVYLRLEQARERAS
jgi:methyl-accepting chemotaxis protein